MTFFLPETSSDQADQPDFSERLERLGPVELKSLVEEIDPILSFDDGSFWFEIRNEVDARLSTRFSETAIFHFWRSEMTTEGGHPRRWFTLLEPTEGDRYFSPVCLCVAPEGVVINNRNIADCHTTGHMNKNPYPDYAEKIAALSEAISIPLPANYMGRPLPEYDASPTTYG